jgi:hypothetical protein
MEGAEMPPYNFQDLRPLRGDLPRLVEHPLEGRPAADGTPLDNHDHERLHPGPDELQEDAARLMGDLFFGKERRRSRITTNSSTTTTKPQKKP